VETQFWTTLEQEVQETVRTSNHLVLEKLLSVAEIKNVKEEANLFQAYMDKVWELHNAKRALNINFYYYRHDLLDYTDLESKVTRLKNEKKQARRNWKTYLKEKEHV